MRNFLRLAFWAVLIAITVRTEVAAKDVPFVPSTETIRGAVSTVDIQNKLVILKSADGVFYDFQVQRATAIEVGHKNRARLEDLASQTGKQATVTFRVLRTGDVALKIEVE